MSKLLLPCSLVILAAGKSERMGTCKFMLPALSGHSLLGEILSASRKFPFNQVVVVTHKDNEAYVKNEFCDFPKDRYAYIVNSDMPDERFHSVQCGLKFCGDTEYVFLHNADTPFLLQRVLHSLYAHRCKADVIIPTFLEKGGHPVLIHQNVSRHILQQPVSSRLDVELKKFKEFRVDTLSREVLVDIDTPYAYENYKFSFAPTEA